MENEKLIIFLIGMLLIAMVVIVKLMISVAYWRNIPKQEKEIIEMQRKTIDNQTATIKNYQSILGKGVKIE